MFAPPGLLEPMEITRGKLLALIVALADLALAIALGGWDAKGAAVMCLVLSGPLAMIWFPEAIGSFTGSTGRGRIDKESPPVLVSFLGWFFLVVGLPGIAYLLSR
jgi:hypothetical protein